MVPLESSRVTWREIRSYLESMPEDMLDKEATIDVESIGNSHLVKWTSQAGNNHPILNKNDPAVLVVKVVT